MTEEILSALRSRANDRGQIVANEHVLCAELRLSRDELADGLRRLSQAGLIEILAPLPFLVAKVRGTWPGRSVKPEESLPVVSSYSFQSSLSESQHLKESYSGPDDAEALMREILETLGETDPTTFRGAIQNYPVEVIREALARVRRMKTIRKSRTAAFRFLLPRIAKESSSTN